MNSSPLALPFEEAICASKLLEQIRNSAEHQLLENVVAVIGVGIVGARVLLDAESVQVVFEHGIPAGTRLMASGNQVLPILVDGQTGKILKVGRVVSNARKTAGFVANSALLAVQVAHMISGHDNAKRLRKVEAGVNELIAAQESELRSRLGSIYRYSKELLHNKNGQLGDFERQELYRQTRELMELRARFRDWTTQRLNSITTAKAAILNPWKKSSLEKSRASKSQEVLSLQPMIQMMHVSLLLQMTLCTQSGKLEAFQKLTLPDECEAWRRFKEEFQQRASDILGEKGRHHVAEFLSDVNDLVEFWDTSRLNAPAPAAPILKSGKKKKRKNRSTGPLY